MIDNNMVKFNLIDTDKNIKVNLTNNDDTININIKDAPMTNNYDNLKNKPQINNITLIGNKSLDDLDIQQKGDYPENKITNTELEEIFKSW